ncbi:YfcL family protein, partial [Salmonella enterica subsp. enterica serovar Anatum]|nr:YfcL family protein [Salmonella enterica subsp. enterica serovar Anatum]
MCGVNPELVEFVRTGFLHASDDELFASGYLRGHLTLAIAELESGDDHSVEAVYANVSQS